MKKISATKNMEKTELSMTNFNHTIEKGFAEELKANPNKMWGSHTGWNFFGRVYFDGEKFQEEVWVYGSIKQTISADSLEKLMEAVNNKYGWE